jgi:uncharacterized protein YndB with AHSA1/START domain
MTVVSVEKDLDARSLTVVAELDAPIERAWELWADPRMLEGWWGPPGHPATVHEHDLTPGGRVTFSIGDASHGWWRIVAVDPPRALELVDGFADADGGTRDDLPTTEIRVRLTALGDRTRMEISSTFSSRDHMEQIVRLGAVDAFAQEVGQMDALLAG